MQLYLKKMKLIGKDNGLNNDCLGVMLLIKSLIHILTWYL